MAKIKYILQGITRNDHIHLIEEILSLPNIRKVIISVGFMKKRGLSLIEDKLKKLYGITEIYVGIRNGITSVQATMELVKNGVEPYLVDVGTSSFIFHPKFYLAHNDTEAKVIIGSANLTSGGLLDNIEASTLIELDLSKQGDKELYDDIISSLNNLTSNYPDNVLRIRTIRDVVSLFREGRLADERNYTSINTSLKSNSKEPESVPRMKTLKRGLSPIVRVVERRRNIAFPISKMPDSLLLWESSPLKESHLNIPSGNTTNEKGAISLVNGNWPGIDKRHYFRDEVFNGLNWILGKKHEYPSKEWASAEFEIVIKGISYGSYVLELSHDTRTNTAAYRQNNYMTDIKWGEAAKIIARRDLLGLTLRIYRRTNDVTKFIMEID